MLDFYSIPRKYNILDYEFWRFFSLKLAELMMRSLGIEDDEMEYYLRVCLLSFEEQRNLKIEYMCLERRMLLAWVSIDIDHNDPKFSVMSILLKSLYDFNYSCIDGIDHDILYEISRLDDIFGRVGDPNRIPTSKNDVEMVISEKELDDFVIGCWEIYNQCSGKKRKYHSDFEWRIR